MPTYDSLSTQSAWDVALVATGSPDGIAQLLDGGQVALRGGAKRYRFTGTLNAIVRDRMLTEVPASEDAEVVDAAFLVGPDGARLTGPDGFDLMTPRPLD